MEEEASVDQSDRYAANNHETILYFSEKPECPAEYVGFPKCRQIQFLSGSRARSLKIMMATLLLFQSVVIPACRQTPDRPSTMLASLHGRTGMYLLEDILDSLCFYY